MSQTTPPPPTPYKRNQIKSPPAQFSFPPLLKLKREDATRQASRGHDKPRTKSYISLPQALPP